MTSRRRVLRRGGTVALTVSLLVGASGCGGDDSASSSVTTAPVATEPVSATTTPEPTGSSATEPPSTSGPEDPAIPAEGEPVRVWVIEDSSEAAGVTFPNLRAGIEARVERINRAGGLGGSGRPVEVEYCVTNFDPNAAAQCARDAVADPQAIAVAGSISGNGDTILPILEAAGMANVGSTAFSQSDGTSSVSFPTMSGLAAAVGCQATLLRDVAGATRIGVARGDTPGADQVGGLLAAFGIPPVAEVVTPVASPDYSAEMGAISAQSDAILLAQDGLTALKSVTALRSIGADVVIAGSGGQSWTPQRIAQAGDAVEGMYLALWYASDDMPGAATYLDDMEAIGALDQSDDQAKLGWLAFELLDHVARELDTIDRSTVLQALSELSDFDGGGLTPPIDFTKPGGLLFGAQPRLVNESCVYAQIRDGRIESIDGEFVTPLSDT